MDDVYLSLGSNLGNRVESLSNAVERLRRIIRVDAVSSIYETVPVGVEEQAPFLNLALAGRTDRVPEELLARIKEIEREVGRRPTFRWGPRVIDIDIILFGDKVLDGESLTVPHAEMARRAFVLVPLAEIAPEALDPRTGLTIGRLAQAVSRDGIVLSPFTLSESGHLEQ